MKKIIISLALCITGGTALLAQELEPAVINRTDFRNRILFGIKGGFNLSNVYDSQGDAFTADSKVGLVLGAFVAIPIGRYLGIQPELLYSQKGFKGQGSLLGSSYELKRTSTYIDVPILFAFKPSEFITLHAGPMFSYLVQQNDVFGNTNFTVEQETFFTNEDLRKNILGFTGGIEFTMKHLLFSARAGWDFQKNNVDGSSYTPRYKNVWYQATVGYRLYQG
jgi:hypothetical protein